MIEQGSMTDEEFKAFVERHRTFGYGRMMQLISDLWRSKDPVGALSVGDTYSIFESKRDRCRTKGHLRHSGGSYDWCDRCGECLGLRKDETLVSKKRGPKIHLREGGCKRGARSNHESHRRFVDAENAACLTCAQICGCDECHDLRYAWEKVSR